MTLLHSKADCNRITWLMCDQNVFPSVNKFEHRHDSPCRSLGLEPTVVMAGYSLNLTLFWSPTTMTGRISCGFHFIPAPWRSSSDTRYLQGVKAKCGLRNGDSWSRYISRLAAAGPTSFRKEASWHFKYLPYHHVRAGENGQLR